MIQNLKKKELLELKHKNKIEEQIIKRMNTKDLKHYYFGKRKNLTEEDQKSKLDKSKKTFEVLNIIMFFIYGLFCILGFQNGLEYMTSAIISLIQVLLTLISLLISMDVFQIFKNDYKLFFIISILLIIPWLAFI